MRTWTMGFVLAVIVTLTSGCGSLSLLSSRHVHYHGSSEVDGKVDDLTKRVEAIEQTLKITPAKP